MTPREMADQFRNLVDDDFDTTHLYQLLTQAKNLVERTVKPEICKKLDQTQSASVGDSYTTSKNLPTDFRAYVKFYIDRIQYFPVKFDDAPMFRGVARKFFLNMRSNTFSTTGPVGQAGTWNIYYIYKTPDFTEATEDQDLCVWPSEFHPLIPYEAAKIYQANIDADAISFRMSASQKEEYQRLYDAFVAWDADLKLAGMDNSLGFDPSTQDRDIDIGTM